MNNHLGKCLLIFTCLFGGSIWDAPLRAADEKINDIEIQGNVQIETEAIIQILTSKKGSILRKSTISKDIKSLMELGYFSDIRFYKRQTNGGAVLVLQVKEKPAITSIEFMGLEEIEKSKFEEKLLTKIYNIVNEEHIVKDVAMIEQQYAEAGFFLARVGYKLDTLTEKETKLVFIIEEGVKVRVGEVNINGNEYFSDNDLIDKMRSLPFSRPRALASSSLYKEEFVEVDVQIISYLYRDQGFAEVKVANPLLEIDPKRDFVRITHNIEEGIQYRVNNIDVAGDLLFTKNELLDPMNLKKGDLFRISKFQKDVESLQDRYGDLGYAYADINPVPVFNKEYKTVDITYNITKGDKVYFSEIIIAGNSKTRDNVIRRELEVNDTELYNGSRMTESKKNINRLGFFEEVQIIKEREEGDPKLLNLKVKVKEKPTGQLQAAIGFSPNNTTQSQVFGQGRYDEKNQFGKGWASNLTMRWNGKDNFNLDLGFSEPHINDGPWSLGVNAFYRSEVTVLFENVETKETSYGGSTRIGRSLFEEVRGSIGYTIQRTFQSSDVFLLDRFREEGITSSVTFALSRNVVDNYLEPTEGSDVILSQTIAGGPILQGDFKFMESKLESTYYYPIDFTESYRTNFRLFGEIGHIYPYGDSRVPFIKRYRLGGVFDLRGFEHRSISPDFKILRAPGDPGAIYPKGGDKKAVFQIEYFFPILAEAGIKGVLFTDAGQVFDDNQRLDFGTLKHDFGFGFRWITPIAPFRIEWAYPYDNGEVGDPELVFYIGF